MVKIIIYGECYSVNENTGQQDLLQEIEGNVEYEYASQTQRFVNWLVDNLLMRFGLSYISGFLLGIVLEAISFNFYSIVAVVILTFLTGYLNYIVYYTICEKLFKGYTLGKLVSGTRAIRQDGQELTAKDAFLRSLSRCVPFEVFSGFSTLTWHDSWTNTMVVKVR